MGFYKRVSIIERIQYVSAENQRLAESLIRADYIELIDSENVISSTCEEVDEIEVKMYWVNKNAKHNR